MHDAASRSPLQAPSSRLQAIGYHSATNASPSATGIATTPTFDRAIRKMDDFLGYGQRGDPDTFWDMDLPPFGWD